MMGLSLNYGTRICTIPHGELTYPAGHPDAGKRSLQLAATDRTRLEEHANAAISETRALFTSLGATEANGAGPIKTIIEQLDPMDPAGHFHNASYNPLGDEMIIGHVPWGASYAEAKDVIAHEFSHRVIQRIARLLPNGESGAVNESLADTFAAAVDTKDWTIAEDVLPTGLRSMIDPGRPEDATTNPKTGEKRPRPSHIRDSSGQSVADDLAHDLVGIPNRAAAQIGEKLGRDEMARLYFTAMKSHLQAEPVSIPSGDGQTSNLVTFAGLAQSTILAATSLYGSNSDQLDAVKNAWDTVGLNSAAISAGLISQQKLAARWERMMNG